MRRKCTQGDGVRKSTVVEASILSVTPPLVITESQVDHAAEVLVELGLLCLRPGAAAVYDQPYLLSLCPLVRSRHN